MIKKNFNFSPNFDLKKRQNNQIKFLIFHYTGMKSQSKAINRLTNIQSRVSCHYLIKENGEIIVLVPDLYVAWHAGKSYWKRFKYLNKSSIGIEISNPGHQNSYKNFSKNQIKSISKLTRHLMFKYKIKPKNILGHSDIAPTRKQDPGEKFPWRFLAKKKIGIWHSIPDIILKKNRLKSIDLQLEKYFFQNLLKIGYVFNNSENLRKKKFYSLIVKAFQRRFRQQIINGKVDKECTLISENLAKKFN